MLKGIRFCKSWTREGLAARKLWKAKILCDVSFSCLLARESAEEKEDIGRREKNCVVIDGRIRGLCRFIEIPVFTVR